MDGWMDGSGSTTSPQPTSSWTLTLNECLPCKTAATLCKRTSANRKLLASVPPYAILNMRDDLCIKQDSQIQEVWSPAGPHKVAVMFDWLVKSD